MVKKITKEILSLVNQITEAKPQMKSSEVLNMISCISQNLQRQEEKLESKSVQ